MVYLLAIGLDGADPDLVRRFGMPNVERKVGPIKRIITYEHSAPSWASFLTGLTPREHGVQDFFVGGAYTLLPMIKIAVKVAHSLGIRKTGLMGALKRRSRLMTSSDIKGERLWQKIRATAGVACIPVIHPPEPIAGWMVAGKLAPRDSLFAYPPSLTKELRAMGFGPSPETEDDLDSLVEYFHTQKRTFGYLLERHPVDLAVLVVTLLDEAQHLVEDEDELQGLYTASDRAAAELIRAARPQKVVVFSDHGVVGRGEFHKPFGMFACNWSGPSVGRIEDIHHLVVAAFSDWDEEVKGRLRSLGYIT
ncbi:MAG: alkaline phosphatase family protein [Candidatus Bathyarchaeia archaeon]